MNSHVLTHKSFIGQFWWPGILRCCVNELEVRKKRCILVSVTATPAPCHCTLWLSLFSLVVRKVDRVRVLEVCIVSAANYKKWWAGRNWGQKWGLFHQKYSVGKMAAVCQHCLFGLTQLLIMNFKAQTHFHFILDKQVGDWFIYTFHDQQKKLINVFSLFLDLIDVPQIHHHTVLSPEFQWHCTHQPKQTIQMQQI